MSIKRLQTFGMFLLWAIGLISHVAAKENVKNGSDVYKDIEMYRAEAIEKAHKQQIAQCGCVGCCPLSRTTITISIPSTFTQTNFVTFTTTTTAITTINYTSVLRTDRTVTSKLNMVMKSTIIGTVIASQPTFTTISIPRTFSRNIRVTTSLTRTRTSVTTTTTLTVRLRIIQSITSISTTFSVTVTDFSFTSTTTITTSSFTETIETTSTLTITSFFLSYTTVFEGTFITDPTTTTLTLTQENIQSVIESLTVVSSRTASTGSIIATETLTLAFSEPVNTEIISLSTTGVTIYTFSLINTPNE